MINTEDILAKTYEDLCSIYTRSNSEKDPITKINKQIEVLVIENVPCALSQKAGGGFGISNQHGSYTRQHLLFTRPGVNINSGNKIVITTKSGQVRTLWAGNPFTYDGSHTETPLFEEEPN